MPKIPDHVSWTQLQTGRCLKAYDEIRVEGKYPREESVGLTFGSLVHESVFEYTRRLIAQGLEADVNIMNEVIEEQWKKSGLENIVFPEYRDIMYTYGEKGFRYDRILDFEKDFRETIAEDSKGQPIILEGIIDRIDVYTTPKGAVLEIIDYKNQMNIESPTDIYSDPQLWLYAAVAIFHLYRGQYWYMRKGKYFTRYNYLVYDRDEPYEVNSVLDTMQGYLEYVQLEWERIKYEMNRTPKKNPQCFEYSGCPVLRAGECPEWDVEEAKQIASGKALAEKVRQARILKHTLGEVTKQIRNEITKDSEITVDGQQVGWKHSESYKYQAAAVINDMLDFDISCDALTISKADIDKLIKQASKKGTIDESQRKVLEGRRVETQSTTFRY